MWNHNAILIHHILFPLFSNHKKVILLGSQKERRKEILQTVQRNATNCPNKMLQTEPNKMQANCPNKMRKLEQTECYKLNQTNSSIITTGQITTASTKAKAGSNAAISK